MRASFQRLALVGLALLLTGQGPTPSGMARDPAMFAVAAADGEAVARALEEARAADDWARWVKAIKQEAASQGISAATIGSAFEGLTPSPRVIALDRKQPERRASYQTYLETRLTPAKVARARDAAAQVQPVLSQIEAEFGVPAAVVVGIWGMETHFGRDTGSFDVVRSLASLAYDGRREALFRRELLAALTMLDRGMVARDVFRGSWAGAVGQGQFLPSSVLRFGVDQDGDGRVDLWNSSADALASIANYLKANGWSQSGAAWGIPVSVPSALDRASVAAAQEPQTCKTALRAHSRAMPVQTWKALGLFNASPRDWPADDAIATLVEPDGPGGPAYLVTGNYRALLAYNCSNFYALSVALLADSLI